MREFQAPALQPHQQRGWLRHVLASAGCQGQSGVGTCCSRSGSCALCEGRPRPIIRQQQHCRRLQKQLGRQHRGQHKRLWRKQQQFGVQQVPEVAALAECLVRARECGEAGEQNSIRQSGWGLLPRISI